MTDEQLDTLVARSTAGEGVEAVIRSMGLDSDREMLFLKNHPTAQGRLKEAKGIQKRDPVWLERVAKAKQVA